MKKSKEDNKDLTIAEGKKLSKKDRLSINDMIKNDNPLIREVSYDVEFPLNKQNKILMTEMITYVKDSTDTELAEEFNLKPAYGISAVQAGSNIKIFYIRIENDFGGIEEFALVNPIILETSTEMAYLKSGEGCLSVDNEIEGYVYRPYEVRLAAIDYITEREIEIQAKGLTAIVLQHEMDHLSGILFYDRINKLNPFEERKNAVAIK